MLTGTGISLFLEIVWLWVDNGHWWIEDSLSFDNHLEQNVHRFSLLCVWLLLFVKVSLYLEDK